VVLSWIDKRAVTLAVYYRSRDKARVVIPMHAGRDIKPKTLRAIINDMRLTPEEFKALL